MKIVNSHLKFPKAKLIDPNTKGYIHIAVEADYSSFPFFLSASKTKKEILGKANQLLTGIKKQEGVQAVSLFKAAIMPPARQAYLDSIKDKIHVAKFDVAILIETKNIETAKKVREDENLRQLLEYFEKHASFTHVAVMKNARRIAEVDKSRPGIFLFNYFFAEDPNEIFPVWEYTAGWFTTNTALDNSTLLKPLDGQNSKYSVINHCRWDRLSYVLPRLMLMKTVRSYVGENFTANNIASMPILYRLENNFKTQ